MLWDFSSHGWKDGVRKFFTDLLKTLVVAGVTFMIAELAKFNPVSLEGAAVATLLRAVLSSFLTWAQTSMFTITPGGINPAPSVEAVATPEVPVA